jgi:1-acyl-sn-glycerol-3-phosphate acyltransferase
MYPFLRVFIGMEVQRNQSLFLGKYIIVSNHSSHTDTSAILSILPISKIHKLRPVAAQDYFTKNKLFKIFTQLFYNAIFIDRVTKDGKQNSINIMAQTIDRGDNLLIFPEGSRVSSDEVGPFKSGVIKILKEKPEIPYIPIYIDSSANTLPKGDGLLIPHNFKVVIGDAKFIDPQMNDEESLKKIRDSVVNLACL